MSSCAKTPAYRPAAAPATTLSLGRLALLVGLLVAWGIHVTYATRLPRRDATRLPRRDATRLPRREPTVQLRTDPELRIRPRLNATRLVLLASWSFGGLFSSFPTLVAKLGQTSLTES